MNCAASPGHYAESSESLLRARHRYLANSPIIFTRPNPVKAREPYELQEEVSLENYDFEDISVPNTKSSFSGTKSSARAPKDTSKSEVDNESQVFAETSAFAKPQQNSFTGYEHNKAVDRAAQTNGTSLPVNNSGDIFRYNLSSGNKAFFDTGKFTSTTVTPTTTARRGSTTYQQTLHTISPRHQRKQNIANQFITYTTPNSIGVADGKTTAAPTFRRRPSTYTTARKIESSRTTPFYTPTVPSIIARPSPAFTNSAQDISTQHTLQSTDNTQAVSEHAEEMIKTLHELNLNTVVAPPPAEPTAAKESVSGQRPGLIIPPSSGPDTLHSLALYFATAVDNLVTKPETTTTFEKSLSIQPGNVTKLSSALVSNSTVEKYKQLFSIDHETGAKDSRSLTSPDETRFTAADDNDLETQYSTNPILAAAGSPQIRELAQVFTHALSAYLHDPNTFRRVLSEIRPTEPTPTNDIADSNDSANRIGRTDDFHKGTGPTYLPTQYTQTYGTTSPTAPAAHSTTEELEVLDFSDVTVSTSKRDSLFTTTAAPASTSTEWPEWLTTTDFATTTTKVRPPLKQTLPQADRVPASRYLTEALENAANEIEAKTATTENNNPVAMEINGGLVMATSIPYFHDDSLENANRSTYFEDTNYFPLSSVEQQTNFSASPYGHGVKPENSTPIHDAYPTASVNSIPFSWNDGFTESSFVATTTDYPSVLSFELLPPASVNDKGFVLPTNEILPPTIDENDLQRAQSQSIVSSSANLITRSHKSHSFADVTTTVPTTTAQTSTTDEAVTSTASVYGHFITHAYGTSTEPPQPSRRTTIPDTGKFSPNPWSTLAYTVFLDPLTINDGLMGSQQLKTVTPSPNTYLPRSTQTYADVTHSTTESTPVRYSLRGSLSDTTASSDRRAKTLEPQVGEYMEVMQKKATAMFGGLNDTSAHHLLNVMKKANKNRTVRKLILLLIQTCDNDEDTSVEESRTALLNALIGMDGKVDEDSDLQIIRSNHRRGGKSIARQERLLAASSTEIPITTYRRPVPYVASASSEQFVAVNPTGYEAQSTTANYLDELSSTSFVYSTQSNDVTEKIASTTDLFSESSTTVEPTTTTEYTTTTTTQVPTTTPTPTTSSPVAQRQRSVKSRRVVKDLDDLLGQHSQAYDTNAHNRPLKHSDTRALDLLKSLYSLAGKFGRR